MFGSSYYNERTISLNDDQFNELSKKFEEQFDIDNKVKRPTRIHYNLKGSINGMKWVNSGYITLTKVNDEVRIKFGLSCDLTFFIYLIISVVFFLYQTIARNEIWFGLLPFFILVPLIITLSFIAFKVFEMRIHNTINETISDSPKINEEQIEWMNNPDQCPACGFEVNNKNQCPDCGLNLTKL